MCSLDWTAVSAIATTIGTFIVGWYTFETQKLRVIGQRQLDVLIASVQPYFVIKLEPLTDLTSPMVLTIHNYGGPARNITTHSEMIQIEIQSEVFPQGSHQHWKVRPKLQTEWVYSMKFDFDLRYQDQHGISQKKIFYRIDDLVSEKP